MGFGAKGAHGDPKPQMVNWQDKRRERAARSMKRGGYDHRQRHDDRR